MTELLDGVTVVIPAIPPRWMQLETAKQSIAAQTLQPYETIVTFDTHRQGAAVNRDAALAQVKTKWTAFLDDDDVFYPTHLEDLMRYAEETDADLVYPWFDVIGGTDPFPQFEGLPWDVESPHQVPITHLVKTEAARAVDGFTGGWSDNNMLDKWGNRVGEDLNYLYKLNDAGYKIVHLNKRTWGWNHWGGNTSGLPTRW